VGLRGVARRDVRRAAALLAVFVVAGCSSPSLPPPLTATGEPGPVGSETAGGPGGSRSGGPVASAAPSGPVPEGFSPVEAELLAALREDAQVNCLPRTTDLPQNATDAIECTIDSDLVERVGVYRFDSPEAAAGAYIARMASYGVALRSGNCGNGTPGDHAWIPGDGPADGGDLPYRIGCFLDENGTANVRVTCNELPSALGGGGRYIGVLGSGTDLADLTAWAAMYPEGAEVSVPTPPGLCVNDALPPPG
jgi:hypothetical protein